MRLSDPLAEKRRLLNETLRETGYYPDVKYPGDCYIFDVVLGIDPRKVVAKSLTHYAYTTFVIDPMTHERRRKVYKVIKDDGTEEERSETEMVTRKFTPSQKRLLAEWWDLLSDEARGIAVDSQY